MEYLCYHVINPRHYIHVVKNTQFSIFFEFFTRMQINLPRLKKKRKKEKRERKKETTIRINDPRFKTQKRTIVPIFQSRFQHTMA